MKTLLFSAVLVFVTTAVLGGDVSPDLFKTAVQECSKELGMTLEEWDKDSQSDDPKSKCFMACCMKKLNMMVDGKIEKDRAMELYVHFKPEADDATKLIYIECINKANVETDECEIASTLVKCKYAAKIE